MMAIKFDYGTFIILIFILIDLICANFFPIVNRNELFGIRTYSTLEFDDVWKSIHKKASIATIPFVILLSICLFIKYSKLKAFLGIFINYILFAILILIEIKVIKKIKKDKI